MEADDGSNVLSKYGTAVTTGQPSRDFHRGSLRDTHSHRVKLQANSIVPLPVGKDFGAIDHDQIAQSGNLGLKPCTGADCTRNGSDSMESMQQHIATSEPLLSDPESCLITETEESDDEDRAELLTSRSARLTGTGVPILLGKATKEKKKVGRPIAYRGDPDAPELTEQERRRIKRRIANRESARRVRHKRQELLDDLQVKIDFLQTQNAGLREDVAETKLQKEDLGRQLREMTVKYKQTMSSSASMQLELDALRSSLQVRMTALENALDRQENGPELQEPKTLFASEDIQASTAPGYSAQPMFPFNEQGDFKGSYSFQMALDTFPSFRLGERSVELLPTEPQDLVTPVKKEE